MSSEPMNIYLREMRRHEVLDRDQEHELALRYRRTHNPAIAHRLAEGHLRLVVKVAREYAWSGQSLADRVQAGNMGLIRSIETFDPERGVRLPTYAVWWIRACIVKMIIDNRRLVRVGTTARQRRILANLRRERQRLFEPGEREGEGEVDAEAVAFLRHATTPEVPLDVPAPGHKATRLEELVSDEESRPDVQLEEAEYRLAVRDIVRRFASRLHGREAVLLRERWLRPRQATLQTLGDRFGLSRERVRQIESRILERLRLAMKVLAVLFLIATGASCAGEVDDRPPRWSYISRAIIQPNCATASCHSSLSATAELRFDTADHGYASLMEEGLIVPGAPEQSDLIAVLRGTGEAGLDLRRGGEDAEEAMPPDAPLPDPDIDLIAAWIAAGAEND